jgi:hypothetical protein
MTPAPNLPALTAVGRSSLLSIFTARPGGPPSAALLLLMMKTG